MPNSAPRKKVDPALQYRWGIVGIVLAALFIAWYMGTGGQSRSPVRGEATKNLEKIVCPRCNNDAAKKLECALCGGLGFIWVDTTKDRPREAPPR